MLCQNYFISEDVDVTVLYYIGGSFYSYFFSMLYFVWIRYYEWMIHHETFNRHGHKGVSIVPLVLFLDHRLPLVYWVPRLTGPLELVVPETPCSPVVFLSPLKVRRGPCDLLGTNSGRPGWDKTFAVTRSREGLVCSLRTFRYCQNLFLSCTHTSGLPPFPQSDHPVSFRFALPSIRYWDGKKYQVLCLGRTCLLSVKTTRVKKGLWMDVQSSDVGTATIMTCFGRYRVLYLW